MNMEPIKYKNKFRVESTRLKDFDYSQSGAYFITICVYDRHRLFGDIEENEIKLSEIGYTAYKFWSEIPDHFPFVALDEFIVMPNHLHGIIQIDDQMETLHATSLQWHICRGKTKKHVQCTD
jgi:putative transposase